MLFPCAQDSGKTNMNCELNSFSFQKFHKENTVLRVTQTQEAVQYFF